MKLLSTILCSIFFLSSCSFGGFKPPKAYYVWLPGKQFYSPAWGKKFDLFTQREIDMHACGIDPILGESGSAEANLCLERKGWYLEGGAVCENKLMWNDPECIKWRAKYSKPGVKPWGK
ncbi:hypothetical protein AP460_02755 [Actinobacillus pleuropneumoniae]|uniref:Lipoprotein n=1 Tax=Actinobacillus pleuropneumoniae serotype 3 (strain JL03) TaxID=434271 RepID=B0BPP6_ACTPJ|nr:hypothetical protein [Actinobacillus pleuropneumoniae]ABY69531.1 hypothetical protein APJL_0973 [Actinobacillus pleuropneumoniae serovar 3 str. JL03]EFL80290.1 hypothetical protein APP6_0409 [Actinobacillus pleuropneumoniae serovar 6 str. Femo]KIE91398.1 hypothetical protein AP1022_02771 [Actinobacillus pleuropneumoniae]KIE91558.1 hypothetical protein AP460_02755 [Actinobacillus pleuropneumoniae]KIE97871.1 hypothetical protein AP780_02822 [Actinobacillus pleuropneumoniae]